MKYFTYLKEKFPFYLSSGIICSIMVFTMVVINSYNGHLNVQLERMKGVAQNKENIKRQIREVDALAVKIEKEFDLDTLRANPDTAVFNALDKIKTEYPESTIRISGSGNMNDINNQRVEIEVPVTDYSMLIEYFQFLESFRIPKYRITDFSLRKGRPGEMLLYINGGFLVPAL